MAKAKKSVQTTERIKLTLTVEEAETLAVITQKIGGSPSASARRFVDNIAHALSRVGVVGSVLYSNPAYQVSGVGITFKDQPAAQKLRTYRDRDNDHWYETATGEFVMAASRAYAERSSEPRLSLEDLRESYSPLTPIDG